MLTNPKEIAALMEKCAVERDAHRTEAEPFIEDEIGIRADAFDAFLVSDVLDTLQTAEAFERIRREAAQAPDAQLHPTDRVTVTIAELGALMMTHCRVYLEAGYLIGGQFVHTYEVEGAE
jgi:hypothetical protein